MICPVETWTVQRMGAPDGGRMERVRRIVAYARERGRFYKERLSAVSVSSLSSIPDLARLPFTRPADVAADPLSFLCVRQADVARVTTLMTSGTGGTRKRIFFTESDLSRTVDFFEHGMRDIVSPGQRTMVLMSDETEYSIGRLLETALHRFDVSTRIQRSGWKAGEALDAARSADCIVGIPAEILYLSRIDDTLRPHSVLLSADFVPRSVIAGIREAWHCRVFTHYGMTETGYGCAVQCASREGHHIRDADMLIEIIDPETEKQCAPGVSGEIVLTTFSEAMPLIRYRTGDMSRMVHTPCRCGGFLPRLDRVEGRGENVIPLADGAAISIHQLDELLFAVPGIRAFHAALHRDDAGDTLHITANTKKQLDHGTIAALLPDSLRIEIRYAAVDPFDKRGKRRLEILDRRLPQ